MRSKDNSLVWNRSLESGQGSLKSSAPLSFLEKNVRFSFRSCDIKNYCIRKLSDHELLALYKRLEHFEAYTWRQVTGLSREKGMSIEKRSDNNYTLLSKICPYSSTFYHFRVNGTNKPFRVFGAQKEDMCCILLLDRDGHINHT